MSCLYILEINYLSVVSFAIIFSHSGGCLFTLLIVSFVVQKLLSLIVSHLCLFYFHYPGKYSLLNSDVLDQHDPSWVMFCFTNIIYIIFLLSLNIHLLI